MLYAKTKNLYTRNYTRSIRGAPQNHVFARFVLKITMVSVVFPHWFCGPHVGQGLHQVWSSKNLPFGRAPQANAQKWQYIIRGSYAGPQLGRVSQLRPDDLGLAPWVPLTVLANCAGSSHWTRTHVTPPCYPPVTMSSGFWSPWPAIPKCLANQTFLFNI